MKRVVRVKADCLAGVLLVSDKLNLFEDLWKHNPHIELEIPFSQYVELLSKNPEYIQYTSLPSRNLFNTNIKGLYPYFVRDVMVAQIDEIIRAQRLNKPATRIYYTVDEAFQVLPYDYLSSVHDLKTKGMNLIKVEESKGRLIHERTIQPMYKDLYDLCITTLGMVVTSINSPKDFYWIVK